MKRLAVLSLLAITLCAIAFAHDSASVLAQILANKGTITSEELARVEAASPDARVEVLAEILQAKGVLTRNELAQVSPQVNLQVKSDASPVRMVAASYAVPVAQPGQLTAPSSKAPEAAPVTSQSKLPVTVYGTILLNSFYNTSLNNIEDVPLLATKQPPDAAGSDKNFGMTARQSRFGLRYQGPTLMGAKVGGQVEVDFFGGKAALGNGINMDIPRLRLAYGRLDWTNVSLVAGQDWSIFAPLNPTSLAGFAIPDMSGSGNPWIRTPQIRAEFRHKTENLKTEWDIAATDPNVGDYQTAQFLTVRSPSIGERGRLPAFDSRLSFTSTVDGRDFALGVSGHYGRGKNFGTIGTRNIQTGVDSWGAALDWSLPFSKAFVLSGEAYEGRALGIFSVATGEAVGAVGTTGEHGVLSRGGWAQAQFNFNPKWQVNLAYGIDAPKATELPVGNRNRNQTYMGNLIYKFSPHVNFAWEWRRFLTDYRNQLAGNERGDHANLGIAYIF
jgi:hypothetical protein